MTARCDERAFGVRVTSKIHTFSLNSQAILYTLLRELVLLFGKVPARIRNCCPPSVLDAHARDLCDVGARAYRCGARIAKDGGISGNGDDCEETRQHGPYPNVVCVHVCFRVSNSRRRAVTDTLIRTRLYSADISNWRECRELRRSGPRPAIPTGIQDSRLLGVGAASSCTCMAVIFVYIQAGKVDYMCVLLYKRGDYVYIYIYKAGFRSEDFRRIQFYFFNF